MKYKIILILLCTAILSSLLRFGQRENDMESLSDSDYYLDMAKTFAGDKIAFDSIWIKTAPHHYNRPLLPYCAGKIGHYLLNDNYKVAFSIVNIFAAFILALLLYIFVSENFSDYKYQWFPSVMFLTSFSQMNWGYHILTETLGLTFAFACSFVIYKLLKYINIHSEQKFWVLWKDVKVGLAILALAVLQMLAFLTRETAYIVFFVLFALLLENRFYKRFPFFSILLVFILITARIPLWMYSQTFHTKITEMSFSLSILLNTRYIFDYTAKMAVAFNISWLFVALAIWKREYLHLPSFIVGWLIACFGYMAAGYAANSITGVGYPMRMIFSLFPVVYLLSYLYLLKYFHDKKLKTILISYFLISLIIGIAGVLLDSQNLQLHSIFDLFGK